MTLPEKKITDFIESHHVLTLATTIENEPYCANCFYVYEKDENMFVFTSDHTTKHVQDVLKNSRIAGSVVLETSVIGKIQGIQFTGRMFFPTDDLAKKVNRKYMLKYPFATLMDTELWVIDIDFIKFTDNRLGFGKKLIWKKEK
jgi:hypothetical protein